MNVNQLDELKRLTKLFLQSLETENYDKKTRLLENIERFLESCIQENPNEIEAYIRLAIVVNTWPLRDYQKAITVLNEGLKINAKDITALLVLSYIYDSNRGYLPEELWEKIKDIHIQDAFIQSMIEQAKAWYYRGKMESGFDNNAELYCMHFKKSILLNPEVVTPYVRLGQFYIRHNNIVAGKEFLEKSLSNIKYVGLWRMESGDVTSIQDFFNISYLGIYVTPEYYELIKEELSAL